jgi:hypothetical protein
MPISTSKANLAWLLARANAMRMCDPDHVLGFPQFPWLPAAS